MRNTIFAITKFGLGALVIIAILGNSGCLVDTGSDISEPKPINQKHLRIYKAGNEIRYDVQIDIHKGSIVTRWDLPVLTEIVDKDPVQPGFQEISGLLKETTTIDYETSDGPVTVVRYITQDSNPDSPTYGSITVHAFNSQSGPAQHNYVNDSNTITLTNPPIPAMILPSPFQLDDAFEPIAGQSDLSIDYYVLPCDENQNNCDVANQRLNETLTLSNMIKENLETTLDYFQAIKVPFNGNVTDPRGSVIDSRKIRLDIRAFCSDVNDANLNYVGSLWFYPAIGITRYEVSCNGDTSGAFFSATVSSVNFAY